MSQATTTRGEGHRIIGQEISWVGNCPWTGTLGFGTESGTFHILPDHTSSDIELPPVTIAIDSVNGVAFNGEIAAFSSRESLFLFRRTGPDDADLAPVRLPYKGGAHGVAASSLGGFVAPVGLAGVLLISPTNDANVFDARFVQRGGDPLYAYRLVMAGLIDDGTEVIAFAAREQGVMAFGYAGGSKVTAAFSHHFSEQDIVSVCSLNHPKLPRGIAALSRDCKIILIRDVTALNDIGGALDYSEIAGTGYDLLAAQGHLFILTSEAFVSLAGIVDEFANGRLPGKQTASFMRTQGVAIYRAGESGIHLIDDKGVTEFPVSELVGLSSHVASGYQQPEEIPTEVMDVRTKAFTPKRSTKKSTLQLAGG